jgi:hypothetical protein
MIKVGLARAFVKSPTPPSSIDPVENEQLKSLFWLHQTDPVNNPNVVIIKRWSALANNNAGGWVSIDEAEIVFVRQELTVQSDGQTTFTLGHNVVNPHLTQIYLQFVPNPTYGSNYDFIITEDGVNYNPNSINNNRLDFLGSQYILKANEKIVAVYQIS